MINAFLAAAAAAGRSVQKPISKYEDNPTNSQKAYSWTIFDEITSPIIDEVNNAIVAKYRPYPVSPCIYPIE
jgi:hypothetical protein